MLAALQDYLQQCHHAGFRGIIHIAGEQGFVEHTYRQLIRELALNNVCEVPETVQAQQQLLGTEVSYLLLNAYQGFNPNALGIASACVQAGGAVLVLTPALANWPDFPDPDYRRLLNDGESLAHSAYFLARCARYLFACRERFFIDQHGFYPATLSSVAAVLDDTQQQAAVKTLLKHWHGRAHRPVVLLADRGRGKSSALGMALGQLMQQKNCRIVITASHIHSTRTLFKHLALSLGQALGRSHYELGESRAQFVAGDEVLNQTGDILIVDEAASLPVALLKRYCQHYRRIVFASTVAGYEGSGQGFALRFLPYLAEHYRYHCIEFTRALRWSEGDVLERLTQTLLLQAPVAEQSSTAALQFKEYSQRQLIGDEKRLAAVFALLLNAHYQTSPDDLRLMLDHPRLRIFVAERQEALVAAAIVMNEGVLAPETLNQGRRLKGHLLPQALAGDGFAVLSYRFARVLRIAVKKAEQQQGIGKQLLAFIESQVDADFIGASFSAEAPLIRFWQQAGCQVCRLGSRKETATGLYACLVLKALKPAPEQCLAHIRQVFQDNIGYLLLSQNQALDSQTALAVLNGLAFSLSDYDRQQCLAYSQKQRSFEQARASLYRAALFFAGHNGQTEALLVEALVLNKHWQVLAKHYNLSGRGAIEQVLRQKFYQYLRGDYGQRV